MQLEESTRRERQQKELSDQVISAFTSTTQAKQADPETATAKLKTELESQINETHPKVKALIDEQTKSLQKKFQKEKDKHVSEVHALEKKL